MRTRIYNKMTAGEIENYLARGGDTIFVGVGVIEAHGAFPVDAEAIIPEAFSLAMAEQADGLALINLPFFFPGGTIVSNATIQVNVRQSIDFLMMLARSLVAQGFRKIFLVSAHGPAKLYIDAMCRDFFQETKIHVCHLITYMAYFSFSPGCSIQDYMHNNMLYGAYKMLGQMDYLPIDPDSVEEHEIGIRESPVLKSLTDTLKLYGGKSSIYYASSDQHGGGRAFHSEAERLDACEKGEKEIRDLVSRMNLDKLKNDLDAYHIYVHELMEEYPRLKGHY